MQSGERIKVFSTFVSINGEVCQAHQGSICTFVRLAGCNLRCKWCDTEYAQKENSGMEMSISHLVKLIKGWGNEDITITGGEPFMQADALFFLLKELIIEGYRISIETNGSIDFAPFKCVDYVVDYKLPSSGESEKINKYVPYLGLKNTDWIKFVIEDRQDYNVAVHTMDWLRGEKCLAQFAMSPILTSLSANNLLQWLKKDHISNVVVSVQLHKLLKLDEVP